MAFPFYYVSRGAYVCFCVSNKQKYQQLGLKGHDVLPARDTMLALMRIPYVQNYPVRTRLPDETRRMRQVWFPAQNSLC